MNLIINIRNVLHTITPGVVTMSECRKGYTQIMRARSTDFEHQDKV